jgi:hypothetical protein
MTGNELRKARNRAACKRWRTKNPGKNGSGTSCQTMYYRRRPVLEHAFGIKDPAALVTMWLRGEIQIMRNGEQVNP